jgi:hypothetical protein
LKGYALTMNLAVECRFQFGTASLGTKTGPSWMDFAKLIPWRAVPVIRLAPDERRAINQQVVVGMAIVVPA